MHLLFPVVDKKLIDNWSRGHFERKTTSKQVSNICEKERNIFEEELIEKMTDMELLSFDNVFHEFSQIKLATKHNKNGQIKSKIFLVANMKNANECGTTEEVLNENGTIHRFVMIALLVNEVKLSGTEKPSFSKVHKNTTKLFIQTCQKWVNMESTYATVGANLPMLQSLEKYCDYAEECLLAANHNKEILLTSQSWWKSVRDRCVKVDECLELLNLPDCARPLDILLGHYVTSKRGITTSFRKYVQIYLQECFFFDAVFFDDISHNGTSNGDGSNSDGNDRTANYSSGEDLDVEPNIFEDNQHSQGSSQDDDLDQFLDLLSEEVSFSEFVDGSNCTCNHTKTGTLPSEVEDLEGRIKKMQVVVSELKESVSNIESKVDELVKKRKMFRAPDAENSGRKRQNTMGSVESANSMGSGESANTSSTVTTKRVCKDRAYWTIKCEEYRSFCFNKGSLVGVYANGVGPPSTGALFYAIVATDPDDCAGLPESDVNKGDWVKIALCGMVAVAVCESDERRMFSEYHKGEAGSDYFVCVSKSTWNVELVPISAELPQEMKVIGVTCHRSGTFDEHGIPTFQGTRGVCSLISHQIEQKWLDCRVNNMQRRMDDIDNEFTSLKDDVTDIGKQVHALSWKGLLFSLLGVIFILIASIYLHKTFRNESEGYIDWCHDRVLASFPRPAEYDINDIFSDLFRKLRVRPSVDKKLVDTLEAGGEAICTAVTNVGMDAKKEIKKVEQKVNRELERASDDTKDLLQNAANLADDELKMAEVKLKTHLDEVKEKSERVIDNAVNDAEKLLNKAANEVNKEIKDMKIKANNGVNDAKKSVKRFLSKL